MSLIHTKRFLAGYTVSSLDTRKAEQIEQRLKKFLKEEFSHMFTVTTLKLWIHSDNEIKELKSNGLVEIYGRVDYESVFENTPIKDKNKARLWVEKEIRSSSIGF